MGVTSNLYLSTQWFVRPGWFRLGSWAGKKLVLWRAVTILSLVVDWVIAVRSLICNRVLQEGAMVGSLGVIG
jgi:hypothetical protein